MKVIKEAEIGKLGKLDGKRPLRRPKCR